MRVPMAALQGSLFSNPKSLLLPSNLQRSRLKLLGSCTIGSKWRTGVSNCSIAALSRGRLMAVAHKEIGIVEGGEEKAQGCVRAVFFDLDDTLVLTHAADNVAKAAVQVWVSFCGSFNFECGE